MPLFFFNVLGDQTQDLEGTELACAVSARREAIQAAGHILSDSGNEILDGAPWIMRVTDDQGGVVCNLQFSTASGEPAA